MKSYLLRFFILPDFLRFKKEIKEDRFSIKWKDFYPQVKDKTRATGFDRHYLYHTAWAARKIKAIDPKMHIDIASSLYFCSLVSAFVPVKFYDYRPPELELPNLEVKQGNLMDLPFENGSVSSLSCMHVAEHIGLGRYGDPIDPEGDLRAIAELKRVLAKGGSLLFVVPVGTPKIQFNAHRIYSYEMIKSYFSDLKLKEFALVPEKEGSMILGASPERVAEENYGCGCFWFIK